MIKTFNCKVDAYENDPNLYNLMNIWKHMMLTAIDPVDIVDIFNLVYSTQFNAAKNDYKRCIKIKKKGIKYND